MLNMNERIMAIMQQKQERKAEDAKNRAESIQFKQNEIDKLVDNLRDQMENILYVQQFLITCYVEKEETLSMLKELISMTQKEERLAKRTVTKNLYPDLNLETKSVEEDEEISNMLNSANLEEYIEELILLRKELEQNRE